MREYEREREREKRNRGREEQVHGEKRPAADGKTLIFCLLKRKAIEFTSSTLFLSFCFSPLR